MSDLLNLDTKDLEILFSEKSELIKQKDTLSDEDKLFLQKIAAQTYLEFN